MKKSPFTTLLTVLVLFLLLLTPVSYAQQISYISNPDTGEKSRQNPQSGVTTTIQVSEDGTVTVLDSNGNFTTVSDGLQPQNNQCSSADLLNLGTRYYAYIDYAGDVDWLKWNTPSTGWLNVKVEVPYPHDYDLVVYSTCSIYVCTSTNSLWQDENCYVYVTSPGYMYAKVYGYNNDYGSTDKYYITGTFEPDISYDLVPGSFTVTPSSPTDGDSITVRYRVTNNGPDGITTSFRLKLYVDDVLYQTCTSNGINAGSTQYCDRTNIQLGQGTHVLKNVVDADGQISETNENNNIKTQNLLVSHINKYDLVPGSFTVIPSSPTDGDSITVRYRFTNNGPDGITTSFRLKLYVDDVLYQTCTSNGINAGSTQYCDRTNIQLGQGTHVLKNVVDADNQISETNEGNNVKTQNLPVISSCSPDAPYEWNGACHLCPQNSLECNGQCYDKQNYCSYGEPFCGADNNAYCCPPTYPYACSAASTCFQKQEYCDGRPIYICQEQAWICIDGSAVGTCSGNTLKCCPVNYPYYWETDNLCHMTPYQQINCNIPNGSSAQCDCDTNADCPLSYPYCEQNYPSPISDGYDACLSSQPEYCGNAVCATGEDYNSCPQDCSAPTGKINVDVSYTSNSNPISGAYVYLDGVSKGTTDSSGKKSLDTSYGQRTVKVTCPDKTFCSERTVNVDGTEYLNFYCGCSVQESELQIKLRTLHSPTYEGYPIYNAYIFLDNEFKGFTDTFGNLYISNINYGTHKLGVGLKIADMEGEEPYEHRYSTDILVDENFEDRTINIELPSQQQSLNQIDDTDINLITVSAYNATYTPDVVPIVAAAIVWVGFTTWAYGDYAKCVEETDSWWAGLGKLSWDSLVCNPTSAIIWNAIDKDHMGNCIEKFSAIAKNTWEKCKLEATFLGVMFIPPAILASVVGKVFVVIKGGVYSVPYVEKFLGYGFKVIKESDTLIKISDGISTFGLKLIGGSLKIYDNVVGMIVKVMENAGVSAKITTAVDDLLRATKPSDLPFINTKNLGNVKGALGEKAAVKTADIVGGELAKGGATFVRPVGTAGKNYLEPTAKYKLKFNDNGDGKIVAQKWGAFKKTWDDLGDLDDFYKINDRLIVTEVKTMRAGNLDNEILGKWKIWPILREEGLTKKVIKRLEAVKEVTGEIPEFIIMIPKGEAAASKQLQNLLREVKNAGFKAEYAELKATNRAFEDATRRIVDKAKQGG